MNVPALSWRLARVFFLFMGVFLLQLLLRHVLLDVLLKGMGAQLIPGILGRMHGFRADTLSNAPNYLQNSAAGSPPLTPIHADLSSYLAPLIVLTECLQEQNSPTRCICAPNQAFRLPGYGVWFAILRLVIGPLGSSWVNWVVLLHIFWSSFAALALGYIVYDLSRSAFLAWFASILYVIFPFVLRYVYIPGGESMNLSFIVLFIWAFLRSRQKHLGWLFLSGVFLTEAILIRPITFVLIPLSVAFMFFRGVRSYRPFLYFTFSFFAFQLYWQSCNLVNHDRFFLLTPRLYFDPKGETEWAAIGYLLSSFGDNYYWYYYPKYRFPERAFTSEFGPEAERELAERSRRYYAGEIVPDSVVSSYANAWRESIRREKPFLYYIGSRFYAIVNFFTSHLQESFYYTHPLRAGWGYTIVYVFSAIIWIVWVGLGSVASVYYLWHWRERPFMAFLAVSSAAAWGSYVMLLQIQSRYFLFPLIFFGILSVMFFWERILRRPVYDA